MAWVLLQIFLDDTTVKEFEILSKLWTNVYWQFFSTVYIY